MSEISESAIKTENRNHLLDSLADFAQADSSAFQPLSEFVYREEAGILATAFGRDEPVDHKLSERLVDAMKDEGVLYPFQILALDVHEEIDQAYFIGPRTGNPIDVEPYLPVLEKLAELGLMENSYLCRNIFPEDVLDATPESLLDRVPPQGITPAAATRQPDQTLG